MTMCSQPVAEQCARTDGHVGDCQCPHQARAEELYAALESIVLEYQDHREFYTRKAARVARATLQRTVMTPADCQKDQEETQARRHRERVAAEANPFTATDLLVNLKARLPELETLLQECSGEWGYEDPVYRLLHHSFKVFGVQSQTQRIANALRSAAPGRGLCEDLELILKDGTGRTFQPSDNMRWLQATRPVIEAFFLARFLLEMAVRYGRELERVPSPFPSGFGALLEAYDLR